MPTVDIDEKDLKAGLLGLVVALVEIIRDVLGLEAVRRMEGGSLTEEEIERLGEALMDLDGVVEQLKVEQGVAESVKAVRDGLDDAIQRLLDDVLVPVSGRAADERQLAEAERT
jgi:hypothetical protein